MPELLNHRHCKNCDRAVDYDEEDGLCSKKCRDEWAVFQKKRKSTARLLYVAGAVGVGLLIMQVTGRV